MLVSAVSDDDKLIKTVSDSCKSEDNAEFRASLKESASDVGLCVFVELPENRLREAVNDIRSRFENAIIVCCVHNKEQAFEAADCADISVTFPLTARKLSSCIHKAKLLLPDAEKPCRIYIRTFGCFDVFVNEKIIKFTNAKAKELLALCVDKRGGTVSQELAIDTLWEHRSCDENTKRLYRKAVIYLRSLLGSVGAGGLFETGRGFCRIVPDAAECDYFTYMSAPGSITFNGDYMVEYSWAEQTSAMLYFSALGHGASEPESE